MNSFIIASGAYPSTSTSDYIILRSGSQVSLPFVPAHDPFSSWRKFIQKSTQQGSETDVTIIPAAKTTTEGPTILKPTPLPDDYDAQVDEFLRFIDSLEPTAEVIDNIVAEQQ
ncbi:MAG: hypothetical protein E6I32_17035 [Chloroflexi bacterium]|nr:MAG: hypothetical protein E6I32_17035 [Chloroflexota bacterium]